MRIAVFSLLVGLIIVAHVFLWRSDLPTEAKLTFTLINAAAWTIILVPILLVGRWLEAVKARNRDSS